MLISNLDSLSIRLSLLLNDCLRLCTSILSGGLLLLPFLATEVLAQQSARNVEGCSIRRGTFCVDMSLNGADLQNTNLANSQFTRSILSGANLTKAVLDEANLSDAQLRGTILNQASLIKTNARRARFNDAQLVGANLRK